MKKVLVLGGAVLLLVTVAAVLSARRPAHVHQEEPTVTPKSYIQVCQTCGEEWEVTPLRPDQEVRPTVEWCLHDGAFCEQGFNLYVRSEGNLIDRDFLNHSLQCRGCRYAAYSPEKWNYIMSKLNEVREREKSKQSEGRE